MSKIVLVVLVFALLFCSSIVKAETGDTNVLFASTFAKNIASTLSKAKSSYRKAQDKIPRTHAQKKKRVSKIVRGEVTASRLKNLIKQGRTLKPQDVLSRFRKTRTLNVRVGLKGAKYFQIKRKWYKVIHAGKWSNFEPNAVYAVCVAGPTAYSAKYSFRYNSRLSKLLKDNEHATVWADLGLDVNIKVTKRSKKTAAKKSVKKSSKKTSKKSSKKTAKKSTKKAKKTVKKVPKKSVKYGRCYTAKQYNKLVKKIKSRYGAKAPKNKPESLVVADVPFTKTELKRKKRCAIRKQKQIKRRKCLRKKKQAKKQQCCGCQPTCGCAAPVAPVAAPVAGKCPARRGANLRFKGKTTLNVKKLVIRQ